MSKLNAMEQVVLGAIIMHPEGATQEEVLATTNRFNIPQSTVTARFSSLLRKGVVVKVTGETRQSQHGRPQRVLKAAIFG